MNCIELRRELLADPRHLGPVARSHLPQCRACDAYAARVEAMDREIDAVVRATPIPEGAIERVLVARRLRTGARGRWLGAGRLLKWVRRSPLRPLAVGTTLAAAALLSFQCFNVLVAVPLDVAYAVIDHAQHDEPGELKMASPDSGVIKRVMANSGLRPPAGSMHALYLGRCSPAGGGGEHLVLNTSYGKATLVLMPKQWIAFGISASKAGNAAVARPAPVGSYVVVAETRAVAERIADLL